MAIAVEIEFADGLRRQDYELVVEGLALDEDPPAGLLAHIATESDGRIRVLEVWESSRQYRSYRERRLMPEHRVRARPAARRSDQGLGADKASRARLLRPAFESEPTARTASVDRSDAVNLKHVRA